MTPPAALLEAYTRSEAVSPRPAKRARTFVARDITSGDDGDPGEVTAIRRHPLGVRPSGNAYLSDVNLKTACGGFAALPDELIGQLLEYLDAACLLRLGATCRAFHAFSRSEEFWKALFVESHPPDFSWRGTWRSTMLSQSQSREPKVDCGNLFSDVLHRPFLCANIPLDPFVTGIPSHNRIRRLSDCGPETIMCSDMPVILTGPTKRWKAYEDWTIDYLLGNYHDVKFRAEAVDWPLSAYIDYLRNNNDESPLYLFDRSFAEKMEVSVPDSASALLYEQSYRDMQDAEAAGRTSLQSTHDPRSVAYWPPTCFGHDQDLFAHLGHQRPDHRWLIVGPARSGSTFHKDPNGTCAWNAVLRGRKYWIMFPSSPSLPPPPGVFVSADQSEVTSPLSIAEWLLTFHAEARATPGCREGVCEQGELLYVPAGWYHLVLNLEESVALTQNFVPKAKLADVLAFLRDRPDQVSGFKGDVRDPYAMFVERLREKEPEVLEEALARLERRERNGKGRWEEIRKGREKDGDADVGGFTFGFGGGGDDEDAEVP